MEARLGAQGERGRAREISNLSKCSLLPRGITDTCSLDYLCTLSIGFREITALAGAEELSQVGGHSIEVGSYSGQPRP